MPPPQTPSPPTNRIPVPVFSDEYANGVAWPGSTRYPQLRHSNTGPLILTPGLYYANGTQYGLPDFLATLAQKPGYAPAHTRYEEMRQFFQEWAYATHGCELVIVKVTMMIQEPGRAKSSMVLVSDVLTSPILVRTYLYIISL